MKYRYLRTGVTITFLLHLHVALGFWCGRGGGGYIWVQGCLKAVRSPDGRIEVAAHFLSAKRFYPKLWSVWWQKISFLLKENNLEQIIREMRGVLTDNDIFWYLHLCVSCNVEHSQLMHGSVKGMACKGYGIIMETMNWENGSQHFANWKLYSVLYVFQILVGENNDLLTFKTPWALDRNVNSRRRSPSLWTSIHMIVDSWI